MALRVLHQAAERVDELHLFPFPRDGARAVSMELERRLFDHAVERPRLDRSRRRADARRQRGQRLDARGAQVAHVIAADAGDAHEMILARERVPSTTYARSGASPCARSSAWL